MKKRYFLAFAVASLLFSSCSGIHFANEEKDPLTFSEEMDMLDEALNNTIVNVENLDEVTPLAIDDSDPYTELTRSIYDFGETANASDMFFGLVDKDDHPEVPYLSTSDLQVTLGDFTLYDNHGETHTVKNFFWNTGEGGLTVPTSQFNPKRVYYLELKNVRLAFKNKDSDIRRLTFYSMNRGIQEGIDVKYKDDIVTLDETKVYYYDEDGYTPYFVYEEDPQLEADTAFRIRHPSLDKDNLNTVYGKIISTHKNPNGAGYMVRYDPARSGDVFDKLAINAAKEINDEDDFVFYNDHKTVEEQVANGIIHNPSMVCCVYGLMKLYDVEANDFARGVIDWGSRIDIKIGTIYDPTTSTFTLDINAGYTFYPEKNLAILLNLEYKQSWHYDVTAQVSIETEFIFPVGIDYTLKVVEDIQKEISFGVCVKYDHAGEYDEKETQESAEKAMVDALTNRSDWQKRSVFTGEGSVASPGGETYPLFKISCTYFLPIEIYFEVDFYWELVPTIELLIKYTSHTQTVDLCVSNSGGADPSTDSATETNKTLSFTLIGSLHLEVGLRVSLGVDIVGFYKFFHLEVYIKAYAAVDIQGFFGCVISWSDDEPSVTNLNLGCKFEISVGLKIGIDLYLLFGGYNHEWPIVSVPLFGAQFEFPFKEFVNDQDYVEITDQDYSQSDKQFRLSLGERHTLTGRYLNTETFGIDIKDFNLDDQAKAVYGAFVPEDIMLDLFEVKEVKTLVGTLVSDVTVSKDGHICMDTIDAQDNFKVQITIGVSKKVTLGRDVTKTIIVEFTNNNRQGIYLDNKLFGSFVNEATITLPLPDLIRYKKFVGYKYEDPFNPFEQFIMISYDEEHPENFTYTVNTHDELFMDVYMESVWEDYYHWEVYFMDGLNNIVSKQMVLNGEAAVEPDAEVRDIYMELNPPDKDHHYQFVRWDGDFSNITGPTVIRAVYKIVNN